MTHVTGSIVVTVHGIPLRVAYEYYPTHNNGKSDDYIMVDPVVILITAVHIRDVPGYDIRPLIGVACIKTITNTIAGIRPPTPKPMPEKPHIKPAGPRLTHSAALSVMDRALHKTTVGNMASLEAIVKNNISYVQDSMRATKRKRPK
jgi:hypothetical protein